MNIAQFLPWQRTVAQQWLENRDRFAHAWLLHGTPGIGKQQFALAAAASLLCEAPQQGLACGHCVACRWVSTGNHPDLRRLRPEAIALAEDHDATGNSESSAENFTQGVKSSASTQRAPSQEIRIAQIRDLASWFNTATHRGGWRVAVLYPAQALNLISANALLKILEEPPAHTVFLLVVDALDAILPTVLSRCRRFPLAAPSQDQALQWLATQGIADPSSWLAAAGGVPLGALRLAQSNEQACPTWLVQLVTTLSQTSAPELERWVEPLTKIPAVQWIDTLQRLYVDFMLVKLDLAPRYFAPLRPMMALLVARTQAVKIAQTAHWLTLQRARAGHPLNAKLFIQTALQHVTLSYC